MQHSDTLPTKSILLFQTCDSSVSPGEPNSEMEMCVPEGSWGVTAGPTPLREWGRQEKERGMNCPGAVAGLGQSSGDTAEMALRDVWNLSMGTKPSSQQWLAIGCRLAPGRWHLEQAAPSVNTPSTWEHDSVGPKVGCRRNHRIHYKKKICRPSNASTVFQTHCQCKIKYFQHLLCPGAVPSYWY